MTDSDGRSTALAAVDKVLLIVAAAAMVAVMLIVTCDVAMRYLFVQPIVWAYDIVGLYMMATLFFLALPYSLRQHTHISVDVLVPHIPTRARHAIEAFGYAATTIILGMLVWLTFDRLVEGYVNHEYVDGAVSLPAWIAQVPVLIGTAVLLLHCAIRCALHAASIFSAKSQIEFAPQSGSEGSAS